MNDLSTSIESARRTVDPAWDAARTRRAHEAFRGRLLRRRRVRIALAAGASLAVAAVLVVSLVRPDASETPTRPASDRVASFAMTNATTTTASRPLRFWDGSTATPVGSAELRAVEVSPARIVIDVERGSGHFDVTPNRRERAFVVRAGVVSVRVVGTAFTVGVEQARTRVSVDHGRVVVEWAGGSASLGDGASGVFPPSEPAPVTVDAPSAVDAVAPVARERAGENWRRLAESGDFGGAFEAMAADEVRDRPEELLLAADAARLSGHPREALTYYQRVVRDHASDPRAPLAAFTMGRVLLTQLGRPRDAAAAFAQARQLAGGGSIAEDALAREVEARSTAGETERARALAEQYVARYPAGARLRAVRRFGGLP